MPDYRISAPANRGEPFYGSDEVAEVLQGEYGSVFFESQVWGVPHFYSFNNVDRIYCLKFDNEFYGTHAFKRARKPEANHPCREKPNV